MTDDIRIAKIGDDRIGRVSGLIVHVEVTVDVLGVRVGEHIEQPDPLPLIFESRCNMRLNAKLPLNDPFMSRLAAQSIVRHAFDLKAAAKELRPDIKCSVPFGAKLMAEPAIRREIGIILDRTENNSTKFIKRMWEWMDAAPDGEKDTAENRRTAARILAKGYISEKKTETAPAKPVFVDGMESGLANLTGVTEKVQ